MGGLSLVGRGPIGPIQEPRTWRRLLSRWEEKGENGNTI